MCACHARLIEYLTDRAHVEQNTEPQGFGLKLEPLNSIAAAARCVRPLLPPVEMRAVCSDQLPETGFNRDRSTTFLAQNWLIEFVLKIYKTAMFLLLKATSCLPSGAV